jgi:hypothetical protein
MFYFFFFFLNATKSGRFLDPIKYKEGGRNLNYFSFLFLFYIKQNATISGFSEDPMNTVVKNR